MNQNQTTHTLIKTPRCRIPIGEPFLRSNGRYVLRIKRTAGKEIEDVPLETLISMIVKEAKTEQEHRDSLPEQHN